MAIARNTSEHKKFYEIIVISVNNTEVYQRMRSQRTCRNECNVYYVKLTLYLQLGVTSNIIESDETFEKNESLIYI